MRRSAILISLLLVVAACGDDAGSATGSGADGGDAPITEAGMLEELRSGCESGDYRMCDILYQASDFGSDLEAFADSCGGRITANGGHCTEEFGVAPDLGDLQTECGEGDMIACDLLYLFSPSDSLEEAFGDECGGIGEGDNRTCVASWGFRVDRG